MSDSGGIWHQEKTRSRALEPYTTQRHRPGGGFHRLPAGSLKIGGAPFALDRPGIFWPDAAPYSTFNMGIDVMPQVLEPLIKSKPAAGDETRSDDALAPTYYVVCWNDPVNLMAYVTHVFRDCFKNENWVWAVRI